MGRPPALRVGSGWPSLVEREKAAEVNINSPANQFPLPTKERDEILRPAMKSSFPRSGVLGVILGVFIAVFLGSATYFYWPWPERVFASDGSPQEWLSSSLLFAGSILALSIGYRRVALWLWGTLALGLLIMALDERFMGHERIKEYLLFRVFQGDLTKLKGWGDVPMLIYPLGAVVGWRWVRSEILNLSTRYAMLWAFGLGAVRVGLLFAHDAYAHFLEQGIEILAEAVFLYALLIESAEAQVQSSSKT